MTREQLIRHLTHDHHINPISVAIQANPHVIFSTGRDLVEYHKEEHAQKQNKLSHKH